MPARTVTNLTTALATLGLLIASTSASSTARCLDERAECRETCTMEHGSSYDARAAYARCAERCERAELACRERELAAGLAASRDAGRTHALPAIDWSRRGSPSRTDAGMPADHAVTNRPVERLAVQSPSSESPPPARDPADAGH